MLLPVTLTIAAVCGAINLWLGLRLVPRRMGGIALGDGGDAAMLAGMRSHANFAEYAPFVLVLMALIELGGGSPTWLAVTGGVFVLARIAHPFGMAMQGVNAARAGGAMATWLVLALLSGWALVLAYGAMAPAAVSATPVEAPRG